MAYEYLKSLFEKGPLSFEDFTAAVDAAENISLVNLKDGGYVSRDKYDRELGAAKTKADGLEQQLTDANTTIQSYKDMEPDKLKESVAEWETRYNTDTQALQAKLDKQETEFSAREYLSGYQFTSELAKNAALQMFLDKGFKRENGKFLGADDFMAELKKSNAGAFVQDTPPAPPTPHFDTPPAPTPDPEPMPKTAGARMKWANEHPGETPPWMK
ncbi:MAG: phage scaffolding protein [Oscillospiraceae bacterium]|nr:phage scaffolding protein [Oscillospiraceae bacterium]